MSVSTSKKLSRGSPRSAARSSTIVTTGSTSSQARTKAACVMGSPSIEMRSVMSTRCGLVNRPVRRVVLADQPLHHARRRRLAVGAGQVHDAVGQLRVAQQPARLAHAVQRRVDPVLGVAVEDLRDDVGEPVVLLLDRPRRQQATLGADARGRWSCGTRPRRIRRSERLPRVVGAVAEGPMSSSSSRSPRRPGRRCRRVRGRSPLPPDLVGGCTAMRTSCPSTVPTSVASSVLTADAEPLDPNCWASVSVTTRFWWVTSASHTDRPRPRSTGCGR